MTKTIEELKKILDEARDAYIASDAAADVALLAYDNAAAAAWTAYRDAKKEIKND